MRKISTKRKLTLLTHPLFNPTSLVLALALTLAGCSHTADMVAADKPMTQPHSDNSQLFKETLTQCPPTNPANTICTAQYDPVCVKIKKGSTISYRTAGNACSACGNSEAIGYVKGECS